MLDLPLSYFHHVARDNQGLGHGVEVSQCADLSMQLCNQPDMTFVLSARLCQIIPGLVQESLDALVLARCPVVLDV